MTRRALKLAVGVLALLVALPGVALATTNEPIAQTGGMEATLPLLGTPLTVGVSLDATGKISSIALNPTGLTQTSSSDGQVTFSNADGSVKVKVRAGGSRLSISAKSTLAGLSGPGTWKADVFGTGAKSSVSYTVGADGTGKPTLAIDAVDAAAGIVATKTDPAAKSHDGAASASAGVTFARDGYMKRLSITVRVGKDGSATLSLTLSGRDRQQLAGTLADLAGSRTWSAHLCDGTAVGVQYHLTAAGDLAFDAATGAPATSKDIGPGKDPAKISEHLGGDKNSSESHSQGNKVAGAFVDGFKVKFTDTNVSFRAALVKVADGSYVLVAKGKSGHCGQHDGNGKHQGDGKGHDGARDGSGDRSRDGSGDGGHH
jgi:hypothetical protein